MCFPAFQNEVSQFVCRYDLETTVGDRMLDLTAEIGELAKEILKATDYGRLEFHPEDTWQDELGDVLFSLICLANSSNVNLLDALRDVMAKYQARLASSGDAGSKGL